MVIKLPIGVRDTFIASPVFKKPGIYVCYLKFVASFNVFRAEDHKHIEIKWVGTGKEWVVMVTKFYIAVDV